MFALSVCQFVVLFARWPHVMQRSQHAPDSRWARSVAIGWLWLFYFLCTVNVPLCQSSCIPRKTVRELSGPTGPPERGDLANHCSWDIVPDMFRQSNVFSRTFPWHCSGNLPEISRTLPGHLPEISCKSPRKLSGISLTFRRNFPETVLDL